MSKRHDRLQTLTYFKSTQKTLQYCKVISLQLIRINRKKKYTQLQIPHCLFKSCTDFFYKESNNSNKTHNTQQTTEAKKYYKILFTFVDDQLFQFSFSSCSFHNFLINSICCNKTIYDNWPCLTNSMTSILGLKIRLGVLKKKNISQFKVKIS